MELFFSLQIIRMCHAFFTLLTPLLTYVLHGDDYERKSVLQTVKSSQAVRGAGKNKVSFKFRRKKKVGKEVAFTYTRLHRVLPFLMTTKLVTSCSGSI